MKEAHTATAHLFISNPFGAQKIGSLFSTHPPVEERIAALRGMGH
jgi:heat shock protein HtpX